MQKKNRTPNQKHPSTPQNKSIICINLKAHLQEFLHGFQKQCGVKKNQMQ